MRITLPPRFVVPPVEIGKTGLSHSVSLDETLASLQKAFADAKAAGATGVKGTLYWLKAA